MLTSLRSPLLFAPFLPPHCFHPVVLERRAGDSCSISFVPDYLRFARDGLLTFSTTTTTTTTLLSPLLSRPSGFSRLLIAPRQTGIFFRFSRHLGRPRDRNDRAGKTFKWSLVKLHGAVDLFASRDRSIWNRRQHYREAKKNQFYGT